MASKEHLVQEALPAAYILAGGQSSRFGSDKARALIEGRPMLVRVAETAARCAADVTVVARVAAQYEDLGLATIADLRPGLGPIGGIQTALAHATQRGIAWAFVISADLVALRSHWLARLREAATGPVLAVVFRGEHVEPLCALYRTDASPHVNQFIAAGGRAVYRLLEELGTAYLPLPQDWPPFAHVNTPQELEQVRSQNP